MPRNGTSGPASHKRLARLTMAALGVVFGDIGTSPLYTVNACFSDFTGLKPVPEDVFGILSLITWVLIIVVTVKYVSVVMRADNRGEGGVLALMALVSRRSEFSAGRRRLFLMLGMAGAALFYGDCLLTPAVTVLSSIEGLNVATPAFEPLVIPLALGVLTGLFAVQRVGTESVGRWFGPVMLVWFVVLLVLGLSQIVYAPRILLAISPVHAFEFALRHGFVAFVALGAVTLAVTGAEALYADMGHFGPKPIRVAWLALVLPSLLANYYGQGALLLSDPTAAENPFFRLAPTWALYPLVVLATAAAVIASQATISGAFSMAQQAALLGLSPRVRIQHTSASEFGQIYVPAINWMQLFGIIVLVLAFKSSNNLAAAYGIAVTGTMLVTTLLAFELAVGAWKWRLPVAIPLFGGFMLVDITLMSSNMMKFLQGGWVPLALAVVVFASMWTWLKGRTAVATREQEGSLPMTTLLSSINPSRVHRPQGTAVYLTAFSGNAPNCLLHNLKHNEVLHEQVVLLTVEVPDEPYVPPNARAQIAHLGKGVHHVVLRYGFMEQPDVPRDLMPLAERGVPVDPMRTSYFVGRTSFVAASRPLLPRWQERLFLVLARFASSAGDFFRLPANRVVELGSRIEI
ncbi:MAG: potassium transporter Kup [Alphaproteobacteria bacterium]|nr:potassium transporter Kup [Alphaproteobacteria bacterium]